MNLILQAQNVAKPAAAAGGWRYDPASADSDLSAAGWQLMALRAAFNNGLPVPQKSIEAVQTLAVSYRLLPIYQR